MPAPRCNGTKSDGTPCRGWRVPGSDKCRRHLPNPDARANAAVRAEVLKWGLGDTKIDPGEMLLRLISQSAARVEWLAGLMAEAWDAAERLKKAHEAHQLVIAPPEPDVDEEGNERPLPPAVQAAMTDLDRIFTLGGVAALIGHTYSVSNSGSLYATGEAIRALARLEAEERDRCAGWCVKAIAAGLAERQVKAAEEAVRQQGKAIAEVLRVVLGDPELGLTAEQRKAAPHIARRHLGIAS